MPTPAELKAIDVILNTNKNEKRFHNGIGEIIIQCELPGENSTEALEVCVALATMQRHLEKKIAEIPLQQRKENRIFIQLSYSTRSSSGTMNHLANELEEKNSWVSNMIKETYLTARTPTLQISIPKSFYEEIIAPKLNLPANENETLTTYLARILPVASLALTASVAEGSAEQQVVGYNTPSHAALNNSSELKAIDVIFKTNKDEKRFDNGIGEIIIQCELPGENSTEAFEVCVAQAKIQKHLEKKIAEIPLQQREKNRIFIQLSYSTGSSCGTMNYLANQLEEKKSWVSNMIKETYLTARTPTLQIGIPKSFYEKIIAPKLNLPAKENETLAAYLARILPVASLALTASVAKGSAEQQVEGYNKPSHAALNNTFTTQPSASVLAASMQKQILTSPASAAVAQTTTQNSILSQKRT